MLTPAEFWAEVKRLDSEETRHAQLALIYDTLDCMGDTDSVDVVLVNGCLETFDPKQVNLAASLSALMATFEMSHGLPSYAALYHRAAEAFPVEFAEGAFSGLEPLFKNDGLIFNNDRHDMPLFKRAIT